MKLPKNVRNDILLILALLLVAGAALLIYRSQREVGGQVSVHINGEKVATYPLSIDAVYELNNGTNTLVIRDGKACISEADCPDKICVNVGWVCYNGQTITCLPNKLTVTVEESSSGIDIVIG